MLKLYTAKNSICTQKALITLAEKGIAYETQMIDLFKNEQFAPWYLAINPKGVVPALDPPDFEAMHGSGTKIRDQVRAQRQSYLARK